MPIPAASLFPRRTSPYAGYGYGGNRGAYGLGRQAMAVPGFTAPPPPNKAPSSGPNDSDAANVAKIQAENQRGVAAASAQAGRLNAEFNAKQAAGNAALATAQAPAKAATAIRKQAQASSGVDPNASPEMAASQLARQTTAGIADPVDAATTATQQNLTPFQSTAAPGVDPQQALKNGVTAALQAAQAGKAGEQTTALDSAYAVGRQKLAPQPASAPRPTGAVMTPDSEEDNEGEPGSTPDPTAAPTAGAPLTKPVKPLLPRSTSSYPYPGARKSLSPFGA